MTPPKEGRAVPAGFTLPWNVTKTMAEVWPPDLRGPPPEVRNAPASKESTRRRMGRQPLRNYRLHDWNGVFLHESCAGMTSDEQHAWKGNASQLAVVRAEYPNTCDLIASEVS